MTNEKTRVSEEVFRDLVKRGAYFNYTEKEKARRKRDLEDALESRLVRAGLISADELAEMFQEERKDTDAAEDWMTAEIRLKFFYQVVG